MTFVGTNVLQGKGSQLSLLPMAPSVNFISDPRLSPLTLTFSLSHRRETDRARTPFLSRKALQLGLLRAKEGDTAPRCPEGSWGVDFLPLLPA